MSVADIFQLSSVRKACATFLMSSLNPSNCLSVLTAASFHTGYNDLLNDAIRFARKNLSNVAKGEEFLAAPAGILLQVFQGQVLNIPDEGFLLKVIEMNSCASIRSQQSVFYANFVFFHYYSDHYCMGQT